ncbi:MAG: glutamate racemase [Clostridium sp.]|nr:glutamate racemase [Prevotella sp.]MCM1429542.1 glutamate racemase [Clostridium sp.]
MSEFYVNSTPGPIGVFDSGYGGLTILREMRKTLPQYDYLYLGDNARAPYGERSFDVVHDFTLQAVKHLFTKGCNLIILACNTASAKALRSIQQEYLPTVSPLKRVLGVIIPTVEKLGELSTSGHVGVLGTPGTIRSHSYRLETAKLFPDMKVSEQAAPMWVPLVENGEADSDGADYFVKKYLNQVMATDPRIDTILLGCTHYPILLPKIRKFANPDINIVPQGEIVAESLKSYLSRHPEMDNICSKNGSLNFITSENPDKFNSLASLFLGHDINAQKISWENV